MKFLVHLVVVLGVALGVASAPARAVPLDGTGEEPGPTGTCLRLPKVSGVAMFGDSMTTYAEPYLRSHGARRWHIDRRNGRPVEALPRRIGRYLRSHDVPPRVAIIALGTNHTPGWSLERYRQAVGLFPSRTRIVFVTTYRERSVARTGRYSAWMRQVATDRPRTTLANWRRAALADPEAMVRDGVHQTRPRGTRVWGNRVIRATERVDRAGKALDARAVAACR